MAPGDTSGVELVPSLDLTAQLAKSVPYSVGDDEVVKTLARLAHIGQWPAAPASASAAVVTMGWLDLTGYECNYNSFHLEDYAPVQVTSSDDGQPRISTDDQVVLLRLGTAVADAVLGLVRVLPQPTPVRCVILANDTNGTFRFHRIRPGEDWIDLENLDRDSRDMTVIIDGHP